mmetsp:Transcript_12390/g.14203  ORF Transcript_12390/g.14203 Transcript_12390/m.14203 type:complete len:116 (+) Transcript_12390:99-446(+)
MKNQSSVAVFLAKTGRRSHSSIPFHFERSDGTIQPPNENNKDSQWLENMLNGGGYIRQLTILYCIVLYLYHVRNRINNSTINNCVSTMNSIDLIPPLSSEQLCTVVNTWLYTFVV